MSALYVHCCMEYEFTNSYIFVFIRSWPYEIFRVTCNEKIREYLYLQNIYLRLCARARQNTNTEISHTRPILKKKNCRETGVCRRKVCFV